MNEVSWDDIRDKVSIAAVGGKAAADVIEVDWSWVGEMNSAGWLEPIEMSEEGHGRHAVHGNLYD